MHWLIMFLVLGMVLGRTIRLQDRWANIPSHLTTGGLVFLLVVMGAQLGANPELLEQIGLLGGQAAGLALAATAASVGLLHLLEIIWYRKYRQRRSQ